MIAGYFDESSDGLSQRVFVVAGFLGRNFAWLQMETRWKQLLNDYGIDYFHAVECEHGRKQFAKLCTTPGKPTPEEKLKLQSINRQFLEAAVRGNDVAGFAVGVDLKDFNDLCDNNPKYKDAFGGSPFYYCYHLVMLSALREAVGEWKEIIAFVGDRHEEHSSTMVALQEPLREANLQLAPYIGSLSFEDKRDYIGLQVADVLAYEVRKMFEYEMIGYPERDEYVFLRDNSVCKIEMCKRACLEEHLKSRGVF